MIRLHSTSLTASGAAQMIPEPYRSRLIDAAGNTAKIDAIRKEAAIAHPELFQPFRCSECCIAPMNAEGDLQCRGKIIPANSTAYCRDYKARRTS